ncbi:uncharacterized protein LOC121802483 [Salvia splendens]|uniref:uncharacterized protein LOC121802483 n=1 Tax=Salvia splendens TaxID=180675 RepID=UPI001C2564E8|nr:uncharacterized protein LOC121802483 [Salvia splendens]
MERDSLHDHVMDLYKSHHKNTNPKPNHYTSKGLLKAPPLSLLHSAAFSLPPPQQQPPLLPLPRRSSSFPAKNKKKSTKSSTSKKELKEITPPKNIARVGRFDNSVRDVVKDRVDMLLGSVMFSISPPPPSSLPLPSFCLRKKLSCNVAAAAGVDAGATDDLRRLLRLT